MAGIRLYGLKVRYIETDNIRVAPKIKLHFSQVSLDNVSIQWEQSDVLLPSKVLPFFNMCHPQRAAL